MPNPELGLAGLALGFSILTKGLEGVAIVGIGYGAYLLLTRAITRSVVWQGIAVLAIAFVDCPAVVPRHGRARAGIPRLLYVIDRHLLGFATDTQRHAGSRGGSTCRSLLAAGFHWSLYVHRGEP
jgi:4-amino-4-deoxy-L-arabinose transferase-like glycosyltransferase